MFWAAFAHEYALTINIGEGACIRAKIDEPIKIGMLQQFASDYDYRQDSDDFEQRSESSEKIAIIGSGPSGLAAASKLTRMDLT